MFTELCFLILEVIRHIGQDELLVKVSCRVRAIIICLLQPES